MDKYNAQVYLFSKLIPVLQNIKKLSIYFFFKTVISKVLINHSNSKTYA